jgi:ATP-dependent Clp protease protease subunit
MKNKFQELMAKRQSVPSSLGCGISPSALQRWDPGLRAAADDEPGTITILEEIGFDWWTGGGVTAKRIDSALRSIGKDNPVTVYINSPGGDLFEGLAIYSLFKEHKGKVTMKIIGLAASAASVIAMAGDEVQISRSAFFMIHNAWVVVGGNRIELREAADWLEPFDMAMADLYAHRTQMEDNEIIHLMDSETWMGAKMSVDRGFADMIIDEAIKEGEQSHASAIRKVDFALAKAGIARSERRQLLNDLKTSMSGAAGLGTRDAADYSGTHDAATLQVNFEAARISSNLVNIITQVKNHA